MLRNVATWCYRRRRLVVVAWIIALVGISVLGQTVGGGLLKTFSLPGTESQRAYDVLGQEFQRKGDTGDIVFKAKDGSDADTAAVRAEIAPLLAKFRTEPHVVSVTSPFSPAGERFISKSGKFAYAE